MAAKRMRVEQVKLDDMKPAPWNPRTITDEQRQALKASLARFDVVEPVVLNADGMILGGHQRYEAARDLGWPSLPAVRVDLDEREARALNVALNKISGTFDDTMLADVLSSIADDPDLAATTGFSDDELSAIIAGAGDVTIPEDSDDRYTVLVVCSSQREQQAAYEALTAAGYDCRVPVA